MKKVIAIGLAVSLVLTLVLGSGMALADKDKTGNGAPSGSHYNLNIIGMSHEKDDMGDKVGGHVIFVPLEGKIKILLTEGDDFAVLDGNGTDGVAEFQLPDPGLDPYRVGQDMTGVDTVSDYSVFVRPLGKPGGWATITTCADLLDSDFAGLLSGKFVKALNRNIPSDALLGTWASVEQVGSDITLRTKGKSTFQNVTAELLTIVFKVEVELESGEIIVEYVRVPIFDPIIENEYWEYDNKKLKLLQVRFYPVGTDVSDADDPDAWDEL